MLTIFCWSHEVVNCDKRAPDGTFRYTMFHDHPQGLCGRNKLWSPYVCLTRQLERRADSKYFLPLSVRYSVIADLHTSSRSSGPHTYSSTRSILTTELLRAYIYIQSGPKSKPHTFVHIFSKYWPIFKIFYWHILWKICNKLVTK